MQNLLACCFLPNGPSNIYSIDLRDRDEFCCGCALARGGGLISGSKAWTITQIAWRERGGHKQGNRGSGGSGGACGEGGREGLVQRNNEPALNRKPRIGASRFCNLSSSSLLVSLAYLLSMPIKYILLLVCTLPACPPLRLHSLCRRRWAKAATPRPSHTLPLPSPLVSVLRYPSVKSLPLGMHHASPALPRAHTHSTERDEPTTDRARQAPAAQGSYSLLPPPRPCPLASPGGFQPRFSPSTL